MYNSQHVRISAHVVFVLALFVMLVGAVQVQAARPRAAAARKPLPAAPSTTASTTTAPPPSTEPPATTPAPPPPPTPPPPPPGPVLPRGKGMWIWQPQYTSDGDPGAVVAQAVGAGLTHLYVRVGSSVDGFVNQDFLDGLLPAAHAAGLKVIGWDFPYLDDPDADAARAMQEIGYATPSGDRIDGYSPDIETASEGVNLWPETVAQYGAAVRAGVGPGFPLIATVPRPSAARQADYPYADVLGPFDAVAPMVYWINASPVDATVEAIRYLSQFGKPVMPVGQAYDGGLEGGPPGTPTPGDLDSFFNASVMEGATAVSFWSWQHANDVTWSTIAAGPEVGVAPPG